MGYAKIERERKKKAKLKLAQRNFRDHVHYVFDDYKENWHHRYLMHVINKAVNFEPGYRRVIITAPPRHGKSELASVQMPAYFMGKRPDMDIIHITYGDALSERMGGNVGKVLESERFREVFPNFEYGKKSALQEKSTVQGGSYKAAGITAGGITGTGANALIIDDPFKNRQDAESQARRDKVWEAFNDDLMSRLEFPDIVFVIATRWHKDDLTGRLLQRQPDDWLHIHLPMFADYAKYDEPWPSYDPRGPGDVLWPEYKNKRTDVSQLAGVNIEPPTEEELVEQIKEWAEKEKEANAYGFYSLYQGRPTSRGGNLIKTEWLQRYNSRPEVIGSYCDNIVLSIDANNKGKKAAKTSSDCALLVLGLRSDGSVLLLDAEWGNWAFVKLKRKTIEYADKWGKPPLLIEDKANGASLLNSLEDDYKTIAFNPDTGGDKIQRASTLADWAESGKIYFPEPNNAYWAVELETIVTEFPAAAIDDPVDALSQACTHWDSRSSGLNHLRRIVKGIDAVRNS